MAEQIAYQLEPRYRARIDAVAKGHTETVILNARNTSGKTLTLFVCVPGLFPRQKIVVRLHRRLHKTFWKIVKAATEWLEAFKALYAPPKPLVATEEPPIAQMLAKAVAAIPEKPKVAAASVPVRDTLHRYESRKAHRTAVANQYYNPDNIYTRSFRQMIAELEAERGTL